jgi:hypothetical protein
MQYSSSLNRFGDSPSASSPGVGVWVVVLLLFHQRGKKLQVHMQYSFSLIKGKKRSLETHLWMSFWGCSSPATYCQPVAAAGFIYCRSQEWDLHSPSPTGFVYLEFFWAHTPFVFSSIQPYPPVAIFAGLFYLEFVWESTLSPLWWSFPQDSHCYKLIPLQGC